MTPTMSALGLARIERITDAGPAAIAAHALQELYHPLFTIGAMHPRTPTAEMTLGPRDPYLLRDRPIAQFNLNEVSRRPDFPNSGPPHPSSNGNKTSFERPYPGEVAHVYAIRCQFFNGQSGISAVTRHLIELK
jgi:hypothetical protein